MNQLYEQKYIREVTLKNGQIIKYESFWSNLCYGIPKQNEFSTNSWDMFLIQLNYTPEFHGNKNRKGRIWCEVDYTDKDWNRCQVKVYQDEFKSMKSFFKFKTFELRNWRMKDIINQLNAEEFIQFLKDNEINYLPAL